MSVTLGEPIIAVDGHFTDMGGGGKQPFMMEQGLAANGIGLETAAPVPEAHAPSSDIAGLVVSTPPVKGPSPGG